MMEKKKGSFPGYQIGDGVWLEMTNLTMRLEGHKFGPKRTEPFSITAVLGSLTYKLKLFPHWCIHDVFQGHHRQFSSYHRTSTPSVTTNVNVTVNVLS